MGEYLSRFTLYDIVGYLLPGLVALCAAFVGLATVNDAWAVPKLTGASEWVVFIIAGYFAGHAIQGVSQRVIRRSVLRRRIARDCTATFAIIVQRTLQNHDILPTNSKATDYIEACFEALDALKLPFENREVFIARQGFFRGSSLSFGFLALASLTACLFQDSVSLFGECIDRGLYGVIAAVCAGASALFLFRYKDFIQHELEFAAAKGGVESVGS